MEYTCVRCDEVLDGIPALSRNYCNICQDNFGKSEYLLCEKCTKTLYNTHVGENHTSIELVD